MMNNLEFNLVSASLAIALFSTFAAVNTWRTSRGRLEGPGYWSLSFAAFLLAMITAIFQVGGSIEGFTQGVSNGAEMAGSYLQYLGLKRFLGERKNKEETVIACAFVALGTGSFICLLVQPDSSWPVLVETGTNFSVAFINTLRLGKAIRKARRREQVFAFSAFLFVTLFLALNLAYNIASVSGFHGFSDATLLYFGPATWILLLAVLAMSENQLVNGRIFEDHDQAIQGLETIRSKLESVNHELGVTQEEILITLAGVVENRSLETANHVLRVAEYSRLLARYSGLVPTEIELVTLAAALHDIGKTGIPDEILLKPGSLTEAERKIMQTHTLIGHSILAKSGLPLFVMASEIALEHHECWDGSGYPSGKRGEETSLAGRIVALADQFDAVMSPRVYKEEWSVDRGMDFILHGKGTRFDPNLAELFLGHREEFLKIREAHS